MSAVLPDLGRLYTREEYRRWCEAQTRGRYERVDGRIVAMAPKRMIHARIKAGVYVALRRAITAAGVPCEAFPDGVTFETGDSDYEPDALVNCGTSIDLDAITVPNPIIVVEVLSPGTASTDTGGKLADYFRVPSVAHYLIVRPARREITHHRRLPSGDIHTRVVISGDIVLDPPGITISVDEVYAD